MLATHTLVWTLLDTQEDQGTGCASRGDPEEPDDQDNEDDEDTEEDEEDKGDGGTHATVVADLHETMKPQGERKALEKDKTRRTRRRRRRRRWRRPRREEEEKEADHLPANGKSEIKPIMTIDSGQEDRENLPQSHESVLTFAAGVPYAYASACTQSRVVDGRNLTLVRIGELDITANARPGKHKSYVNTKTERHCEQLTRRVTRLITCGV